MPRQIHQLLDALVGRRGQLRKQEAALLCVLADLLDRLTVIAQQVGLVGNNDLRTRCQKLAVTGKLCVDLLNVVDRVAALTACRVNQMQQQSAAINVAQEVVAQTGTLARALDNARNVGHDEVLLLTDRNHTKVGHQSRKVVVCNLRARRRDHAQQRGLADVREADQTDIGQQLQLKDNVALDTRQTRLGKTRCLTRRRCKMRVAPAAVAALGCYKRLAVGHILHDLTGLLIADDRAARYANDQVRTVLALAALAAARLTGSRNILFLVTEIEQRGQIVIHLEDDRAAAAAVAAVRTAGCHILFAVETNLAVTALAGYDLDFCNINKHGSPPFFSKV